MALMSNQDQEPTFHPHFPSARASSSTPSGRPSHPPSKLSPPPGADVSQIISTALEGGPSKELKRATTSPEVTKKKEEREANVPKRGYRACVHCRMRKARCDLGDVNAPSEPPCSRCRREQRECVFLPSKRRRRTSTNAKDGAVESAADVSNAASIPPQSAPSTSTAVNPVTIQLNPHPQPSTHHDWTIPPIPALSQSQTSQRSETAQHPPWPQDILSTLSDNTPFKQTIASASQALFTSSHPPAATQPQHDTTTPGSLGESSVTSASGQSPGHRTKRRRSEPEGTRKIVNASLSNEMDALEILANAATDGNSDISERGEHAKGKANANGEAKKVSWEFEEEIPPERELKDFHLIKRGIVDEQGLQDLVAHFFTNHHPSLPIFQTARIPRTREQLIDLAYEDPFLLTCIIAVASHHPTDARYHDVHDKTWPILRETMADYSYAGLPGSIGFVEGVLLLAENLPRDRSVSARESSFALLAAPGAELAGEHGTENRRIWSLTGLAIRAAYLLGLDQIALEINEAQRDPDVERARSVWTWCYLYDRTIDKSPSQARSQRLRSGLAFWSRGPSLSFIGYSHISQTGPAAARVNFPLQLSPGDTTDESTHDDSASFMQALVELTQIMTNAHDILYPSKSRTAHLVRQGEYFLFLDHFRRALDSYRTIWKAKKWSNPTLHELSWMTFHFVRLYISSFGYSAHVKRAQWRGEEEPTIGKDGVRQPVQLFPRGSATSPDALYIYESIGAANEIMHISLRLAQIGSLRYLPSRYLINMSYAAVFALKSSYSGAVTGKDMLRIRDLVDHVCAALVLASTDKDHPAVRYGQMLRMLSKKLEQLSDASAVPSRFPSPEPSSELTSDQPAAQAIQNPLPWTLPTETFDPPSFQMPTFPDLSPIPASTFNFTYPPAANTQTASAGAGVSTGAGTNDGAPNFGLGLHAINIPPSTGAAGSDAPFDFDGNMNFDLRGFWDDFALGEGGGFPFR